MLFSLQNINADESFGIDGTPFFNNFKTDKKILTNNLSIQQTNNLTYNIGDTLSFWSYNFANNTYYSISAVCKAKGKYSYIFVENEQWGRNVLQEDIFALFSAFEDSTKANSNKGMYEIITETFGTVSQNVDGDSLIFILVLDIKDGFFKTGGYISGYFNFLDEDIEDLYSNKKEMIYMDCYPGKFRGENNDLGVLAHEFQHLIHWGKDPNETTWINEGCSDLAQWLCGYSTGAHLKYFLSYLNTPIASDGIWLQLYNRKCYEKLLPYYGSAFTFITYIYDHFGGKSAIKTLVANQNTDMQSIEDLVITYNKTFQDVFKDWLIANYIDNPDTNFYKGIYGYKSLDLKQELNKENLYGPVPTNSYKAERIVPKKELKIFSWSANYITFNFSKGDTISLPFQRYDANGMLPIYQIKEKADGEVIIDTLFADSPSDTNIVIDNSNYLYNKITLLPIFYDATMNYCNDYDCNELPIRYYHSCTFYNYGIIETSKIKRGKPYPNPFSPTKYPHYVTFNYDGTSTTDVKLFIYTLSGELVKKIYGDNVWDGKNDNGIYVADGVYIYNLFVGNNNYIGKVAVIKGK